MFLHHYGEGKCFGSLSFTFLYPQFQLPSKNTGDSKEALKMHNPTKYSKQAT